MRQKAIVYLLPLFSFLTAPAQEVIDLSGSWNFHIGELKKEHARKAGKDRLVVKDLGNDDFVMLPGSMLTNGKGNTVSVHTQWTGSLYDSSYYFNPYMERYRQEGNMKFPFFLTPERHYVGAAWYGRTIYVPDDWSDKRIMLFLERPHIETTVFVNGHEAGHQMSLSTPHVYDVTKLLKTGKRNDIVVRVYNGIENVCVGQDSHSVTDQTQGNWNGITGRMELQARPKHVNIRSVRVYPDLKHGKAHVKVLIENHANQGLGRVHLMQLREYGLTYEVTMEGDNTMRPLISNGSRWINIERDKQVEFDIHMTDTMRPWDEFTPNVFRLTVYAGNDQYTTTFGFRNIAIDGRQMLINGRPLFIRGTVENCCFPETGYPPTDEEEWLRIFRKCKEYGLNMVRFHSACRMIQAGGMRMLDVCEEAGFSDYRYFSNCFKKQCGLTPEEYSRRAVPPTTAAAPVRRSISSVERFFSPEESDRLLRALP